MLAMRVEYKNNSDEAVTISKWVNNAYTLASDGGEPAFWSFQGASYEDRRDWVLPLAVGFSQDNYFGMNASDYGSGTPVSDVWRRDIGIAVGHLETVPKLVSLPVRYLEAGRGAEIWLNTSTLSSLHRANPFRRSRASSMRMRATTTPR
jgi:alpha-galactosidase